MIDKVTVVHRDAHLLVLAKPAGIATTSPDGRDCLTEIAQQLDPDAPRLHPTSRLDAEVSGLVTFARTERATRALLEARRSSRYERRYVALLCPPPADASGSWRWSIALDPRDPRRRQARDEAVHGNQPPSNDHNKGHSQIARSDYTVLGAHHDVALACLTPHTGRTHQLRVHAQRAGCPIFGDRHYGGSTRKTTDDGRVWSARRVMLHCAALRLPNPANPSSGRPLTLRLAVPDDLARLWTGLGGAPAALDTDWLQL